MKKRAFGKGNMAITGMLITSLVLSSTIPAFGQTDLNVTDFTVVADEAILNDPAAQKILENIEIAKQRIAQLEARQKQQTDYEKFMAEQRDIAQAELEKDMRSFDKEYEDYTPRNAFARFVSSFNSTHQDFYWDQFEYMQEKIKLAEAAKQQVLDNDGTSRQAQEAYIQYASMSRAEMVKTVSDLNIKHGFSNSILQSFFDEEGNLPRYETDQTSICFACGYFEEIKQNQFDADELPVNKHENATNSQVVPVQDNLTASPDSAPGAGVINVSLVDTEEPIKEGSATITRLEKQLDTLSEKLLTEDDTEKQKEIIIWIEHIVDVLERLRTIQG